MPFCYDVLGIYLGLYDHSPLVLHQRQPLFFCVRKAAALDGLRRKELSCSNAVTESLQKSNSEAAREREVGAKLQKKTESCFTFP